MEFRQNSEESSEIIIGIIGPIGCNRRSVIDTMRGLAKHYSYRSHEIRLSKIIRKHVSVLDHLGDEYTRVVNLMTAGNELRGRTKDNSILAKLAAVEISNKRKTESDKRIIYIIDSLKRPEEV